MFRFSQIASCGRHKNLLCSPLVEGKEEMNHIVVFDSGYGGELFADYIEKEVPILETIRVIDWQQSQQTYQNPKTARARTLEKLRPYINHTEAIIITNQLVSTTSLEYFRKKYPSQKFSGFSFGQVFARKSLSFPCWLCDSHRV